MTSKVVLMLGFVIIASGCVSININHELHKDGSSDLAFEVESESQIVKNSMKETLNKRLATDNAVLDEEDNSFTYRFSDVYVGIRDDEKVGERLFGESIDAPNVSYNKQGGIINTEFTIWVNNSGLDLNNSETSLGSDSQQSSSALGSNSYSSLGDSISDSISLNYNVDPFGKVVSTNGQELSDGSIRFDLTKDKDYYVKFKSLSADLFLTGLTSSKPKTPEWEKSEWSECSLDGKKNREVNLENEADNYVFKPKEQKECEYKTDKTAEEMTLDSIEGFEVSSERSTSFGYRKVFEKNDTSVWHTVIKPEKSTDQYIDDEISDLESQGYSTAIEYISEADKTEAVSKTLSEETETTEFGYEETVERKEKVVFISKHDVVHRFDIEGKSNYLGIQGVENFEEIAQKSLEITE